MGKTTQSKSSARSRGLEQALEKFTSNQLSVRRYVKSLFPLASQQDEESIAKVKNIVKKLEQFRIQHKGRVSSKSPKGEVKYRIPKHRARQIVSALESLPRLTTLQMDILMRGAFLLMISHFEYLTADLLRIYYTDHPAALSAKEESLSLSELLQAGDLNEAQTLLIGRCVEKLLYEGPMKRKKLFEETLKLDCGKTQVDWARLQECFERRHLIVHNDSRINGRYQKIVEAKYYGRPGPITIGDKIGVNPKYFEQSWSEIYLAGIILAQNSWRKWYSDSTRIADTAQVQLNFEILQLEEWALAERLCRYSLDHETASQNTRLIHQINHMQCLKWEGRAKELEPQIAAFDESCLTPEFLVAISAPKGDEKEFYKRLRVAFKIEALEKADLHKWPIFREMRHKANFTRRVAEAWRTAKR